MHITVVVVGILAVVVAGRSLANRAGVPAPLLLTVVGALASPFVHVELNHELAETTMDPGQRTLRRVNIRDADAAARVFELLMGSEVSPRKDFIVEGAAPLDRERIDA